MTPARPLHALVDPPEIGRPRPFVERRARSRRAADRAADREIALLARALDTVAGGEDAERRLAGLLGLLAETVGAVRAGLIAEGTERRVAVSLAAGDREADAVAFGRWLDAAAPRPRSHRAASLPAPVLVVSHDGLAGVASDGVDGPRAGDSPEPGGSPQAPVCVVLPIDGLAGVALGFAFEDERTAAGLARALPAPLARHAAVALSLVTEQLRLERELSMLRSADAERSGFVSTVAHELRTPLSALSGYLDLILDGRVADPAIEREFLERGQSIVGSMGDLVGDLLEWSRLEAGSLRLDIGAFSLADATGRVATSLMPIALERGLELASTLPPRLRAATGDRRRVEQILTNVAANALKFTPAGRRVELMAWFDGSVALVAVRDEGAGIAADDRARIFERFYRMAGHEKITGTGLGLPIARELARAMGGDLGVASVQGSGSSFVLALPGPAPAAATTVEETLERALLAEEIGLEERAVVRAMQHAGRKLGRPA